MRHTRRTTRLSPRTLVITIAIVALAALVPVVISLQSGDNAANAVTAPGQLNAAQQGEAGTAGPVTELDKTFLVKVRQAGLWEIPAGRLAQTNGSSEAVKRAGHHLLEGHSRLDQLVREDAEILGVELPNEATEEQQQWVTQMEGLRGEEFDKFFANVLRSSHGKIFATIGEVRAGTQNDLIRRHAREANQTVLDHMEVLEDTGLVTGETLAEVETAVTPPK
ncbi:DUF4142 domain-containing protein [Amycolatopsis sp. 195334CR]|uniref:DUF4142 domain-containing protein n=1 Tax=Amycolatopsis sp. 195334CR TaxID=2814588 RepID=UPI001A8EF2E0|nr:DUF4142 domain-containing protein [Amycolatopsis sp. 195334CR]MBN6039140.1 DUF4142 domain-containing protein [Amycolatopsis sp. 195334CR]